MDTQGHDLNYKEYNHIFILLMGGLAATHVALDHYDDRELDSDFQQSWDFFYKLWEGNAIDNVPDDSKPENIGADIIYGAIDEAIEILKQKEWHLHQIAAGLKKCNTLSMAVIDQIIATPEPPLLLTADMSV